MERDQFEAIVRKMEALNARDPEGYRRKVARFGSLGFVVFGSVFVFVFGVLGLVIWALATYGVSAGAVKGLIIFGILAFAFARSVVFNIHPPEGREVTPKEAPRLFAELERISKQIGAPKVHKVLLDRDFNAFASSSTKFGMFGEQCYVVLGVPLLATQREDEVIATLAHELAHHSKSHVRAGTRAYRLESMWVRVLHQLSESGSVMTIPMVAFAKWYSPRFSAMSLVLRRQAEFEADAVGASATSNRAMALGLVRMGVDSQTVFRDYYDHVQEQAGLLPEPIEDFYSGMDERARALTPDVSQVLRNVLRSETIYHDSHPSTRERTEALGIPADPEDEGQVRAIEQMLKEEGAQAGPALFGENWPTLLKEFDAEWSKQVSVQWKERHKDVAYSRERLSQFEGRDVHTLSEKEAQEYLKHAGTVLGTKSVAQSAIDLAASHPSNADIQYFAGYSMLTRGEKSGIDFLVRAADMDPKIAHSAFEAIAHFHSEQGESLLASQAAEAAHKAEEQVGERYSRLYMCYPSDPIAEFGGDEAELSRVVALLPKFEKVKSAYAMRKVESNDPRVYLDVLALIVDRPTIVKDDDEYLSGLTKKVYEAAETTRGFYIVTLYRKSPTGQLLEGGQGRKVYDASESRGPA